MKRTIIIGAAGFVGKYLTKELNAAGHQVVAADLPYVDLINKNSLERVFAEPYDYVVNLAAISSVGLSWKNPIVTMEVNVFGTLNLLDVVRKFSPNAKVLLVGSSEEYAAKSSPLNENDILEASNPYGISKIAQENFADLYRKKYGMRIVCTRSFNHTGIGQNPSFALPSFCKQVAEISNSGIPGKIFVGDLSVCRDFSDVRDVVLVYRKLLENENEYNVYNVGSGQSYKMSELLEYIVSLSKVPIEICVDPAKVRPVDIPYQCADNCRVKEFWRGTSIKQTIKEMFDAFVS